MGSDAEDGFKSIEQEQRSCGTLRRELRVVRLNLHGIRNLLNSSNVPYCHSCGNIFGNRRLDCLIIFSKTVF